MTMTTGPRLEQPIDSNRANSERREPDLHRQASALAQQNPGQWVRVGYFSGGIATVIKSGSHSAYPGQWEVTTRKSEDPNTRQRIIYVRYLGT